MKTNTFLLMIAATVFALAGCSAGTTVITEEFDASICLEDPTVEGCDTIVEDGECDSIWDPDCAGDIEDDDEVEIDETEEPKTAAKAFAIIVKQSYTAESGDTLVMPLEVKDGTGTGPFIWEFEGTSYGATIELGDDGGRSASVVWTAPDTAAGKAKFTVKVTDGGAAGSLPKKPVISVTVADPMELDASFKGGTNEKDGQQLVLEESAPRRYSAEEADISDGSGILISVKKRSQIYDFTSSDPAIDVAFAGCDASRCYGMVSCKKAVSEIEDLSITIKNRASSDKAVLQIGKLVTGLTFYTGGPIGGWHGIDPISWGKIPGSSDKDGPKIRFAEIQLTSPTDNRGAWKRDTLAKAHVIFCRDSEFSDCLDPISIGVFYGDDVSYNSLDEELKGKDPAYLDYFKVGAAWDPEEPNVNNNFMLGSVRVLYQLDKDIMNGIFRTAYWNPCVGKWLQPYVARSETQGKNSEGPYFKVEVKFGKNDTAVCAVTYTHTDDKADMDAYGIGMELQGVFWDSIKDFIYRQEFTGDQQTLWATSPGMEKTNAGYAALETDYSQGSANIEKLGSTTTFTSWNFDDRDDSERGHVESFGNHFFNCNPFDDKSCNDQQASTSTPEFDKEVRVRMTRLGTKDGWKFGWYSAIVFMPGHVMKYDEYSGTETFASKYIYSARDDRDTWVEGDNPFSETRTLKTNSNHWTEEKFAKMGSCFYYAGSDLNSGMCDDIVPDTNRYN